MKRGRLTSKGKKNNGREGNGKILTTRQKRFCEYYLKSGDEYKAYRKAGYNGKGDAKFYARKLLKESHVQNYLDEITGSKAAVEDIDDLNPRQAMFVIEYLQDFNATAAAKRAGYYGAVDLMRQRKVRQAMKNIIQRKFRFTQLSQNDLLTQLARIIMFDPRDLYDDLGNLKDITELEDDVVSAIEQIEVIPRRDQSGSWVDVKNIKAASKLKAIELYGKYYSMWHDNFNFKALVAGVMQVPGIAGSSEEWNKIVKMQTQLLEAQQQRNAGVSGEIGSDDVIDIES